MTFKRKYELTQLDKGHPLYLDFLPTQIEVHITDGEKHWLFYIMPKEDEDLTTILKAIDNFSEETLDLISSIWCDAYERQTSTINSQTTAIYTE